MRSISIYPKNVDILISISIFFRYGLVENWVAVFIFLAFDSYTEGNFYQQRKQFHQNDCFSTSIFVQECSMDYMIWKFNKQEKDVIGSYNNENKTLEIISDLDKNSVVWAIFAKTNR